jgi:hypothetical protein
MTEALVAVLLVGAGVVIAVAARRWFRPKTEPVCRCGHLGLLHEHYRSADRREECGACACEKWRPVR